MLETAQIDKGQLDSLIDDLKSDHALTRRHARTALVEMGVPAVASLIALLSDSDALTRWEAVKTLGEIGKPDVAEALVRAMEHDQDEGVRWLAADGLAGLYEEGLAPVLEALEGIEPAIVVPPVAHNALKALNGHDRR